MYLMVTDDTSPVIIGTDIIRNPLKTIISPEYIDYNNYNVLFQRCIDRPIKILPD